MDFVFQGFQSNLPIWAYILLFLGMVVLSWWSYRGVKSIKLQYRYGLIFLRSLVFFILLALLLNPFYQAENVSLEKSEIMVLLDNSESVSIQKGSYQGQDSYGEVLDNLRLYDTTEVNYRTYFIGSMVEPGTADSLSLNDSQTNLYNTVDAIRGLENDISGVVLVTDGIFNQGRNPVFEAGNLQVPVITVALGDTVEQNDIILEQITTNGTGYLNTRHPVEAIVSSNGFSGKTFQVQLKKGNEVLDEQNISPGNDRSSHTIDFELNLQEEGLQQFEIAIPAVDAEWTSSNNSQPFAIDVLNEKQRIVSLAFEVYPDVRFIRSELLKDENTRLIPRTWIGGDRFIEGTLDLSADTLDLLILHGYPRRGLSAAEQDKLNELIEEIPTVLFYTPLSSIDNLQRNANITLPVRFDGRSNRRQLSLKANAEPTEHPIMEIPEISYDLLPLITSPIGSTSSAAGTKVLFMGTYQNSGDQQPVIIIDEIGNIRRTVVSGFGWYRYFQSSNEQVRGFAKQLFSNIISWTATKPDNRKLKVRPLKKVFTGAEPIILNADLTNESGERESDAAIEVTISGESIETRFYSLTNLGNGKYQLNINSLPEGIYDFSATAKKGNRMIDTLRGEFSVSNTNAEFVQTVRNDNVLKQISERTGGAYFTFSTMEGFTDTLNEKGMLAREEKVTTTLFYPYQHSFWFLLVMTLLAAEWITRKYLALT